MKTGDICIIKGVLPNCGGVVLGDGLNVNLIRVRRMGRKESHSYSRNFIVPAGDVAWSIIAKKGSQ